MSDAHAVTEQRRITKKEFDAFVSHLMNLTEEQQGEQFKLTGWSLDRYADEILANAYFADKYLKNGRRFECLTRILKVIVLSYEAVLSNVSDEGYSDIISGKLDKS